MKILYIPLDERPCNYKYPLQIVEGVKDIEIIVPPMDILNKKKESADIERLWEFVKENIAQCDYGILSLDMLIYGGLLPSRLHHYDTDILIKRCQAIRELKVLNPSIKLYGFNLIMRVPSYDSAEEEPDYYATYGESIFKTSWLKDKLERGHGNEDEKAQYEVLLKHIPKEYFNDYFERRENNYKVTEEALNLVKEGIFEDFVIPQDDSSLYGVQSQEQGKHRQTIRELSIASKVYMYPGADEVGCTLLSRIINNHEKKIPKVFVRFSSVKGAEIIPKYEDRPYYETLKSHVISSGMCICDSSSESDLVLIMNTPGVEMIESWEQNINLRTNTSHRNLNEIVIAMKNYINEGKKVILADVAYSNGGDLELLDLLREEGILHKLYAYGGWNTNGNTLGTVLAMGTAALYYGENKKLLAYRLIEDCGYQALARQKVINLLPSQGLGYYDFKDKTAWVQEKTKEFLQQFINEKLTNGNEDATIKLTTVSFPWRRMFEVDLELEVE